jgi:hypothetical protein
VGERSVVRNEKYEKIMTGNAQGKRLLRDAGVVGKIILKFILYK